MSEEKRDGAVRIFEALSAVDEELLERSETPAAKKAAHGKSVVTFMHKHYRGLATAACFAVLCASVWSVREVFWQKGSADMKPRVNEARDIAFPSAGAAEDTKREAELAQMEAADAAPKECEPMESEAEAGYESHTDELSDENGNGVNVAKQEMDKKEEAVLSGSATKDNVDGGSAIKELTESEARNMAVVGAYIPEKFPEGYVFESARGGSLGTQHDLFVCYTRGMDDITLSYCTEEESTLVFTDPENPIFYAEDLCLELIEARMNVITDEGDADTPGGNFKVYYKKAGVLVKFNGRESAEEILAMFESVKEK